MDIYEQRMYLFKFPYEGTELMIPVKADSRVEAGEKLQKLLAGIQTDLAMEFPKIQQVSQSPIEPMDAVPSLVLDLKVDELLLQLGASPETDVEKAKIVKKWTKIDYLPQNYQSVVNALEKLKHGKE